MSLKVISITTFEITIAIFQEADAYECRTGIEEGGVKKTIVVSLKRITLPAELHSNINNTRNLYIYHNAKSDAARPTCKIFGFGEPGALRVLPRIPEVPGRICL